MDKKALRTLIDSVRGSRRRALYAPEAKQLCDAYRIPIPKQTLAKSAADAVKIAARFRSPVVLKIVSDNILHKTEAGGVIVGLSSSAEIKRGFARLIKNAKAYQKNAAIQG